MIKTIKGHNLHILKSKLYRQFNLINENTAKNPESHKNISTE